MTEQNESEEITPLSVSPKRVRLDNMAANKISENAEAPRGAFPDEIAEDIGFKRPSDLGDIALSGLDIENLPDEIKIEEPSAETVNYWPEEFEYRYTKDGTKWLCALDSKNKVFAKIKATASSNAGNTEMLFEVTQPLLNHYKQKQRTLFDDAETTLGKAA